MDLYELLLSRCYARRERERARERESQRPMQWMSHSPPSPPSPHTHTPCFPSTDSMGPHTHTQTHTVGRMHACAWAHAQTNTHRAPGGFLPILSVVAKPVNMSPLWITANGSCSYACTHTHMHVHKNYPAHIDVLV